MPIVLLANQKGGVSKTSTAHHVGGALAKAGRHVLLVDADPQSSLTQGLLGPEVLDGLDPAETIAAVLLGHDPFPADVVRPTGVPGLDLMPGSPAAWRANVPMPWEQDGAVQRRLADVLAELAPRYDLVIVDSPPTLSGCSWAGLVAADALVVPLQAEDYGAQGIRAVGDWIATVRATANPRLRLLGYLISMFNPRLAIHKAYEQRLRAAYGTAVFETMIPLGADFKEAVAARQPLEIYKPRGASAKAVRALAAEMLARLASADAEGEAA